MLTKLRTAVSQAVQQCDLFCSPITLRYKNDNDFKTLTGGVCSLFLVCVFVTVFYSKFMSCLNMTSINTSVTVAEQRDAPLYNASTSEFMFVTGVLMLNIQFESVDMTSGLRYFNISMDRISVINKVRTTTSVPLGRCTRADWERLGPEFASYYDNMNFQRMLCPNSSEFFELQGTYSSDTFRYFKLSVTKCSGNDCYSDTDVANYVKHNDFFKLNFYFSTWLLNPEEFKGATLKLDDSNYMQFTTQLGVSTNLYFESFTINTNYGLTPIDDYKQNLGMIPSSVEMRPFLPNNELVKLYLRKARTLRTIERSFTKFDELFSYIGGLFGMILVIVAIPLKYYNVCCYELSLATGLFTIKRPRPADEPTANSILPQTPQKEKMVDQLKPRVRRFNFLMYLLYLPYFCMKKVGVNCLKVRFLQPYYDSIHVLRTQIDISHILRKFIFLDRVSRTLLDEHQLDLLYVIEKEDITDIRRELQKARIHKEFKSSVTLNQEQSSPAALNIAADIVRVLTDANPNVKPEPAVPQQRLTSLRDSQFRKAFATVANGAESNEINRRILERVDKKFVEAIHRKAGEEGDQQDITDSEVVSSPTNSEANYFTFASFFAQTTNNNAGAEGSANGGLKPIKIFENDVIQEEEVPQSPNSITLKRACTSRGRRPDNQVQRTPIVKTQNALSNEDEVSDCVISNFEDSS